MTLEPLHSPFKFDYKLVPLLDQHRHELIELRQMAYQKKYSSNELNPTLLRWNHIDEISNHFGLFEVKSNQLITTMRLTVSSQFELFEKILLYKFNNTIWQRPFAIFSRAATHPAYANCSLSFTLRLLLNDHVFANNLSENIFGLVADDVQRLSALKRLGYQIYSNPAPWRGCISRPENSSYVVCLNRQSYKNPAS